VPPVQPPSSAAEEPVCQERLHVATPVRNEINDHLLSGHAIDDAIGLKNNLPIFLVSQRPGLVVIGLFRSIHLSTYSQNTLGVVDGDLLDTFDTTYGSTGVVSHREAGVPGKTACRAAHPKRDK
jgi:hypothetical protein